MDLLVSCELYRHLRFGQNWLRTVRYWLDLYRYNRVRGISRDVGGYRVFAKEASRNPPPDRDTEHEASLKSGVSYTNTVAGLPLRWRPGSPNIMPENGNQRDYLDRVVLFLHKRDGTDKTLKVARYTVKLLLATSFRDSTSETAIRLKNFESSVGISRKAFRIGKFLQDVNTLRKMPWAGAEGALEVLASGGEGIYYFIEQFVWLVKAGALSKEYASRLQKASAWAELVSYSGSITLKSMAIRSLREKEIHAITELAMVPSDESFPNTSQPMLDNHNSTEPDRPHLLRKLETLRLKRLLKTLGLIQDVADALLALDDVWESPWNRPALLAVAGLVSALLSSYKNWVTV